MEWMEESISKSTREIQSNSVAQTEEILERHEKNLDQLDKKKKVFNDQKVKGEKLATDPKAPKFLTGQLNRLTELWKEANKAGDNRLIDLKKNLEAWESYENKRNQLDDQLNQANNEYTNTVRVYDLEAGPKDHTERLATASKMRKQIEETFKQMSGANDELAKLLEEDKKQELAEEVIFGNINASRFLALRLCTHFNSNVVNYGLTFWAVEKMEAFYFLKQSIN